MQLLLGTVRDYANQSRPLNRAKGKGYIKPTQPREIFYSDVDPEIAEQAVGRLGLQAWASTQQPLTQAAWHTIPSTYIVCEADNAPRPSPRNSWPSGPNGCCG